jgi:SH3-like domain-containing protein
MKRIAPVLAILTAILLAACGATATPSPTAIPPADTLAPTLTQIIPSATATVSPTLTPTITLTATPFAPFDAVITGGPVNLRASPGYLFPVLRMLKDGDLVTILGKAPGGDWFRVQTQDKVEGWVYRWLLRANVDLQEAPTVDPQNVQRIQGRVRDQNGIPIKGVGFSVTQGNGTTVKTDTVLTDSNGEFFSFMPLNAFGTWTVLQNAIACDSNVWTDTSCTYYKNGYKGIVVPPSINITLPYTGVLEFTWT